MQLTGLFALLAAATLTLATPRPSPKECDVKTMQLHAGHGHEGIIKSICSNYAAAGAAGDAPKAKAGKSAGKYHRRMCSTFLNFFYS
jgi:hypothetical protein